MGHGWTQMEARRIEHLLLHPWLSVFIRGWISPSPPAPWRPWRWRLSRGLRRRDGRRLGRDVGARPEPVQRRLVLRGGGAFEQVVVLRIRAADVALGAAVGVGDFRLVL